MSEKSLFERTQERFKNNLFFVIVLFVLLIIAGLAVFLSNISSIFTSSKEIYIHLKDTTKINTSLEFDTLHTIISDRKIVGDFNGDGKKEELIYELVNQNGEILDPYKILEKYDFDELMEKYGQFFEESGYVGRIVCSDKNIPTIDSIYGLGLLVLMNEGDLDEDGADEISFSERTIQHSYMADLQLRSLKKYEWKIIDVIGIREWYEIPDFLNVITKDSFDHSIQIRDIDRELMNEEDTLIKKNIQIQII